MTKTQLKTFVMDQLHDEARLLSLIDQCLHHIFEDDGCKAMHQFNQLYEKCDGFMSLETIFHNVENAKKYAEEEEG